MVQILLRGNSLRKQIARAAQIELVVHGGCPRFREIVIRLLNFLRTRAMFQLRQARLVALDHTSRLLILSAEFLVLEPHQNLSLFYLVAFFHADPSHSARHLGIHADFVMSHTVSPPRKHRAAPHSPPSPPFPPDSPS